MNAWSPTAPAQKLLRRRTQMRLKGTAGRGLLALLIGLLSPGLVSCEPALPSQEDIVGTWVYDVEGSTYKATDTDGTIEFRKDGRFQLEKIPQEVITDIGPETVTSESGTWQILDNHYGEDRPVIQITTDGSPAFPGRFRMDFMVEGNGEGWRLIDSIGDPDAAIRYILRKQ